MDVNKYSTESVKGLLSSLLYKNHQERSDNSLEETLVEHSNEDLNEYLQRIESFTGLNWFAKPLWLSPPVCARYGWQNVQADWLQCVTCRAFLSGVMPASHKPKAYRECCTKLKDSLTQAHHRFCRWPNNPAPESFLQISPPDVEEFKQHLGSLLAIALKLPKIDDDKITEMKIGEDDLSVIQHILEYPQADDIFTTAFIIVMCGWHINSASNILHCEYCKREAGLWNYFSLENSDAVSDEDNEEEEVIVPMKKQNKTCSENISSPNKDTESQRTHDAPHVNRDSKGIEHETLNKVDDNSLGLLPLDSEIQTETCAGVQWQESEPFEMSGPHSEYNIHLSDDVKENDGIVRDQNEKTMEQNEPTHETGSKREEEQGEHVSNTPETLDCSSDKPVEETVCHQEELMEADDTDENETNQNNNNLFVTQKGPAGGATGSDLNSNVSSSGDEDVYENDTIGDVNLDETSSAETFSEANDSYTGEGGVEINDDSLEYASENPSDTASEVIDSREAQREDTGSQWESVDRDGGEDAIQNTSHDGEAAVETRRSADFISDDEDLDSSEILEHLPSDGEEVAEEEASSDDDIVVHAEGSDNSNNNSTSEEDNDAGSGDSNGEDEYDAQGSEAEEIDLEAPSPGDTNDDDDRCEQVDVEDKENDGDIEDEMDATLDSVELQNEEKSTQDELESDDENENEVDEEEGWDSSEMDEADTSTENTNQNNPNSDPIVVIDSSSEEEQEADVHAQYDVEAGSESEEDYDVEEEEGEGQEEVEEEELRTDEDEEEEEEELDVIEEEGNEVEEYGAEGEDEEKKSSEGDYGIQNGISQPQTFRHTYSTLMQQGASEGADTMEDSSFIEDDTYQEGSSFSQNVGEEESMISEDIIGDSESVNDDVHRSYSSESKDAGDESDDVVVDSGGEDMQSDEDIIVHSPGQDDMDSNTGSDPIVRDEQVQNYVTEETAVIDDLLTSSIPDQDNLFQDEVPDAIEHDDSKFEQFATDEEMQPQSFDIDVKEISPTLETGSVGLTDENEDATAKAQVLQSSDDNVDIEIAICNDNETRNISQSEQLQISEHTAKADTSMHLRLDASDQESEVEINIEEDGENKDVSTNKDESDDRNTLEISLTISEVQGSSDNVTTFTRSDLDVKEDNDDTSEAENELQNRNMMRVDSSILLGGDISLHSPDISLDGFRTPMSQSSASLAQIFNQSRASTPDGQFSESSQAADMDIGLKAASRIGEATGTSPKKRKRKSRRSCFDPLGEHRSWCAWVATPEKLGMKMGSKRRSFEPIKALPGWKVVLETLLKKHKDQEQSSPSITTLIKASPSSDGMRRVFQLLDDWTSPRVTSKET